MGLVCVADLETRDQGHQHPKGAVGGEEGSLLLRRWLLPESHQLYVFAHHAVRAVRANDHRALVGRPIRAAHHDTGLGRLDVRNLFLGVRLRLRRLGETPKGPAANPCAWRSEETTSG